MTEGEPYRLRTGVVAGWLGPSTWVIVHGTRRMRLEVGSAAAALGRGLMSGPVDRRSVPEEARGLIGRLAGLGVLATTSEPVSPAAAYADAFAGTGPPARPGRLILLVSDDRRADQCVADLCAAGREAIRLPFRDSRLADLSALPAASCGLVVVDGAETPPGDLLATSSGGAQVTLVRFVQAGTVLKIELVDRGGTARPASPPDPVPAEQMRPELVATAYAILADWLGELADHPDLAWPAEGRHVDLSSGNTRTRGEAPGGWPRDRDTRNATSPRFPRAALAESARGTPFEQIAACLGEAVEVALPPQHELFFALFAPVGGLPAGYFRWHPDSRTLVQLRRSVPQRRRLLDEFAPDAVAMVALVADCAAGVCGAGRWAVELVPTRRGVRVESVRWRARLDRELELRPAEGERVVFGVTLSPGSPPIALLREDR
ncbi:hypothetical protein Cs7R123_79770 [Catellatospora sp. TT07R-123]|uniref:hypothetical protein n=1 Tax=Catellatospora sp. TT07R-123 TaxID=2733863 RepID=UPI001B27245F|nr:hypothetical protein [Catellatospora sp. TT07R-123]GHJ50635.1 hypothetical protein Cs7R123_79770 [Catellatospora sp. TT07R-123]